MSPRLHRTKQVTSSLFLTLLTMLIVITFLIPIIWLITSSLRPSAVTFATAYPPSFATLFTWPPDFTNYQLMLQGNFPRTVFNSLLVSGVTVVVGLCLCSLAAYAFAALEFPGKSFLFGLVIVGFLLPFEALSIPLSLQFRDWGLGNSYIGLILPGLANGLSVFILRQFFLAIPPEIREAARIDGATEFRIFLRIYLPLSKPALIGAGLILFLFQWQAYLWPLLITSDSTMDLAPVAIARNFGMDLADYGLLFPEVVMIALIPILLLLALQRYFISSLASTGSKE